MCDPRDDTVDQFSSLMSGVACQLARHDYERQDYKDFFQSLLYVCHLEDKKFATYTNEQKWNFEHNMTNHLDDIEAFYNQTTDKTSIGIASELELAREYWQDRFSSSMESWKQNPLTEIYSKQSSFVYALHSLTIMLSELCAGTMAMRDVLGISKEPRFTEFKIFLKIMEVYGGGYKDDTDYSKFNSRQKITHHESMIIQLEKLIYAYELTLSALHTEKGEEI